MTINDPNRLQQTPSEFILLIQLMERINSNIETIKGHQQSANSTQAMIVEQLISLRGALKEWEKETLETRNFRNDLEIQSLEAKDKEYATEMEKIRKAQEAVQAALDNMKNGKGKTEEKMKAIVNDAIAGDKVDIRGVKLSSRQFTYVLIGLIVLLGLLIIFLPDAVAQILMRLAGMIGTPAQ